MSGGEFTSPARKTRAGVAARLHSWSRASATSLTLGRQGGAMQRPLLDEVLCGLCASLCGLCGEVPYQTRQAFSRTIASPALQPKACWNSGMFATTPFTR